LTGAAELGGDWELEANVGIVQTAALAAHNWSGTLQFDVTDIQVDEDGNLTTDGDADATNDPELFGLTLDPALREGGQFADIVATDVAFNTDINTAQTFTIPAGVDPTNIRITVGASDSDNNVTNDNRDQDHLEAVLNINLIDNTYSGTVWDFSRENGNGFADGKFTFAGQDFGLNGTAATVAQGELTGAIRDVVVDYDSVAREVTVTFSGAGGADQGAYLVEYLDAANSSLDALATVSEIKLEGDTSATEITLTDDPDVIVLSANLSDSRSGGPGFSDNEPRGMVRLILQRQTDGTFLANGTVTFTSLDAATGQGVSTYTVSDYVVNNSPDGTGVAFLTDPLFANGDTSVSNADSQYDAQLYINNGNLVIQENASFGARAVSLYNAERYVLATDPATGQNIGSSAAFLGSSVGQGDLTTTRTTGSNFTFDIPSGADFGTISYASQSVQDENGGRVNIIINLERDPVTGAIIGGTSAGTIDGQRNQNASFITWSGVSLTTGQQLINVDAADNPAGVQSNQLTLGGHLDNQWPGVTITLDNVDGQDVIRIETLGSAATGNFADYNWSGAGSNWFGSPAVIIENVPEGVSFTAGNQIDATTWSFAISEVSANNVVNFDAVSDNFNGTFDIDVHITNDPTNVQTHRLTIVSNGDASQNPATEGETLTSIAADVLNPAGDTVNERDMGVFHRRGSQLDSCRWSQRHQCDPAGE